MWFVLYWRDDGGIAREHYAFGTCIAELVMCSDAYLEQMWARYVMEELT